MCSLVNLNKLKKMKKGVCHVVIFFKLFSSIIFITDVVYCFIITYSTLHYILDFYF